MWNGLRRRIKIGLLRVLQQRNGLPLVENTEWSDSIGPRHHDDMVASFEWWEPTPPSASPPYRRIPRYYKTLSGGREGEREEREGESEEGSRRRSCLALRSPSFSGEVVLL